MHTGTIEIPIRKIKWDWDEGEQVRKKNLQHLTMFFLSDARIVKICKIGQAIQYIREPFAGLLWSVLKNPLLDFNSLYIFEILTSNR